MNHIPIPPAILDNSLQRVAEVLDHPKHELRLVGGCVRDLLLNHPPKDIDLAIGLTPDKVVSLLKNAHIHVIETGIEHGTVTAIVNGKSYEITSLRRDVECDGRHAVVEYTDNWQEDAARRDFTINAMSCRLNGELFDYFGGQKDLNEKKVIFVGAPEQRIKEDALRILRFFRFAAYYNNEILDEASLKACINQRELLQSLSGERIQTEMIKLLSANNCLPVLNIMYTHNILPHIHLTVDNIELLKNLSALEHSKIVPIDPYIRLALLLRSDTLSERKALLSLSNAWRLSNKDGTHLSNLIIPRRDIVSDMPTHEQKALLRQIGISYFKQLVYIAMATAPQHKDKLLSIIELTDTWHIPEFPLSGRDIIAIGIPPSRTVGTLLKAAEQWWEEQNYTPSKNEIIDWIRRQH